MAAEDMGFFFFGKWRIWLFGLSILELDIERENHFLIISYFWEPHSKEFVRLEKL